MMKMEKDLEIKYMNIIPTLEPTKILYRNEFVRLENKNEDFFDYIVERYPNKILDMFENVLKEDSEEIKLLDSKYFKLIKEEKYLNFIVEIFKKNSSICYVEIPAFENYNDDLLLRLMNELDIIDKYILMKQKDVVSFTSESKYIVKDENLLKMLFKCMLRELTSMEFYFLDKPIIIFSNYDMSIPLVFKNKEDIEFYKKIAEKNSLFLR